MKLTVLRAYFPVMSLFLHLVISLAECIVIARAGYTGLSVCLCVCLSVCPRWYGEITGPISIKVSKNDSQYI